MTTWEGASRGRLLYLSDRITRDGGPKTGIMPWVPFWVPGSKGAPF